MKIIDKFTQNMTKLYCYFFYVLYKFWLKIDRAFGAPGPISTYSKALICMFGIEVWFVFSVVLYYGYFSGIYQQTIAFSFWGIIPFVILFALKWRIFERDGKWRVYIKEFDRLSKDKNRIGFWIVSVVVIFIALNFVFALVLNPPQGGLRW